MKTQIEGLGIKDVARMTSPVGWLLLLRPVVYLLFSRKRDLDAYSAVDFSAMIFILYAFVAFIMACRAIFRSESGFGRTVVQNSAVIWFIAYSLFGIASMAWSVNYALTGFRAFECIALTLLIVAVIQDLFDRGDLKFVMMWSLLYCTCDTLCSLARTAQWTLSIGQLLQTSQMMSTCFFFIAIYLTPRRWYNWLAIVMSVFSMSTVAYIGLAFGFLSSFWNRGKTKYYAIIGVYVIMLITIAVGPHKILKDTIFFDKQDVSIEYSSGRDKLMDVTIKTMDENPWGLGFFAAEPYILYNKSLGAISAHNSFFSAGMGMGYAGIGVLAIFFLALFRCVFSRYIPKDYRAMLIGCFLVAFLHCMGNPSVGTRVFGAWMPCMYIFVLVCGFYVFGKYYELKERENDSIAYEEKTKQL